MDKVEGEEGGGEMYGQSNKKIYNTIHKTDRQWEFAVWLRELKTDLSNNLEGWDGERGWREVQVEGTWLNCGWFMLMFGRNQCNTVEELSFN